MAKLDFTKLVAEKLKKSREKNSNLNSAHEAYAVILEEVDEFKEWVWKKRKDRDPYEMLLELVDIASAVQRSAEDLGLTDDKWETTKNVDAKVAIK